MKIIHILPVFILLFAETAAGYSQDKKIIYGTHNSATSGRLVWWLRPLQWIIEPTSKCQDRTIDEQLLDDVRLFNLQVTKYRGEWLFSHGLAIYEERLLDTIEAMKQHATNEKPIYFQLFLDDCFFTEQDEEAFCSLVETLNNDIRNSGVIMLYAYIENKRKYPYKSNVKISCEEHYWTTNWAEKNAKSKIDHLPLPKRHAENYNKKYKENCKKEFLMLDFYNQ